MDSRIYRFLKVIAFNANGIGRQHHELCKQLQDLHIDLALFSETHIKPHGRFYKLSKSTLEEGTCLMQVSLASVHVTAQHCNV
jgi:hypothetical protein